ncbi:MAG TPA: glycine cleavage T C-terminal barrel domain-containing protein [Myxococcota bacterium]|nr:glycine cleavage T C-terminal barrel domain-containing protein [Myxococcota bacterium]
MSALATAVRRGAGVFALDGRGLLVVRGGERVRWLNGMITNDVAKLAPGPDRSGCHALLLTQIGRIVADLHVLLRSDAFWLETERETVAPARARLERLLIADDVVLADESDAFARFGIEGPKAPAVVAAAAGDEGLCQLARHACREARIADVDCVAFAWGWSGEPALQLVVPSAGAAVVREALGRAGEPLGLVSADPATLELLRVEAGVPRYGAELSEEVLPAEARLDDAVSYSKGCYTGQEIVARMRSRGNASHLLVGLVLPGDAVPARGAAITSDGRVVGEVTSAALSPAAGAIALGFVRRGHDALGTRVEVDGLAAEVRELPFVPPSAPCVAPDGARRDA